MNYVGIDPGKKGGMCLLSSDKQLFLYCKMPDTVKDIIMQLHQWYELTEENMCIVSERAQSMPKQGISSAFNYGRHFGIFEVSAYWMGIAYHDVLSRTWKTEFNLSSEKANSIILCERIFPNVNLILKGCRVKHDGIAEAILLAEWGRRKNL
jgi:hypothetical protein